MQIESQLWSLMGVPDLSNVVQSQEEGLEAEGNGDPGKGRVSGWGESLNWRGAEGKWR